MKKSLKILISQIIDYAGLFPPAALDMGEAARNFRSYRNGDFEWALGRFVLPVSRIEEFEHAAADVLPSVDRGDPWKISVLVGPDLLADLDRIHDFNYRYSAGDKKSAVIDTLEIKAPDIESIENSAGIVPDSFQRFFEIAITDDMTGIVSAIQEVGASAKVRTGGVEKGMFPLPWDLLRFIKACYRAGVPFKATAGLHHPTMGNYRLTYDPDSLTAQMHGFLNVFVAAAFVRHEFDLVNVLDVLIDDSPAAYRFEDEGLKWYTHFLSNDQLFETRRNFALSFGSCSFDEPISDLKGLNLL